MRKGFSIFIMIAIAVIAGAVGFYLMSQGTGLAPQEKQESTSGTDTVTPANPETMGLANYTDLPLDNTNEPYSVKYIVEHRSALDGKTVTVRGFIVDVLTQEEACPTGPPYVGMCAQPRLFIADTLDENRDKYLDISVPLYEFQEEYSNEDAGKTVEIKVVVEGSKTGLVLRKA